MTNNMTVVTGGDIQTNCYIVHDGHNCIMFDYVPEAAAEIDRLGLNVLAVFITHLHFDHYQMIADFQRTHSFTLYMSETARQHINDPLYTLTGTLPPAIASKSLNVSDKQAVGLSDGETVDILNMKITIVFTPGHSLDSSSYIVDDENIVFVGDTVFCGGVGRTDLYGGDMQQLYESKSKLFDMLNDDTILYPGHGPATSVIDEL